VKISLHKILTKNDTGETGAHQAGFHIPKNPDVLSFFPKLGDETKNPRIKIVFTEVDSQRKWIFVYIYYNNKKFGGTRNEYRLTCATKYINSNGLSVGDTVVLEKVEDTYTISHFFAQPVDGPIILTGKKRIILI
jgi:hypothetical protein